MATDEKELQSLENDVEKLRDKVAAEESKREQREAQTASDIHAAELRAEKARLEARLSAAQQANKAATVKEGAQAPLEAAVEDQKHAEAVRDAVTDK